MNTTFNLLGDTTVTTFPRQWHDRPASGSPYRRRIFVGCMVLTIATAAWQTARCEDSRPSQSSATIGVGPQLFLDDQVIEKLDGLERQVSSPQRLAEPVLDSKSFGVTQPYVSVIPDRNGGKYRIWYNHGPAIWQAESADGIHWNNPRLAWDLPRSYGASLIDDFDRSGEGARRYKLANWQALSGKGKAGSGIYAGFSPDGSRWTASNNNPVLPGVGDIVDVFYDPLARRYGAAVKLSASAKDGYAAAPRAGKAFRRLVGMSVSKDFVHWEKPWRIFVPDSRDEGLLEFYGMGAIHFRGSLAIGSVRVLRDDLPCDPGGPSNGIGYSVLASSRDGITWHRFREPFLNRNLQQKSWDHAMTWIGDALPVGDEVFLYYGGYARGHKVEPGTERQIGLARMKKDRYVALRPTGDEGTLVTRPFVLSSDRLTLNADAAHGDIRVRILSAEGKALPKLDSAESVPVQGDNLAAKVRWRTPIERAVGKSIRLEFRVRRAALFGFEFQPPDKT